MREEANWYQNGHIRPLTQIQLPKGIIKRAREVFSQRKTELIITEFYFPSSLSIISIQISQNKQKKRMPHPHEAG